MAQHASATPSYQYNIDDIKTVITEQQVVDIIRACATHDLEIAISQTRHNPERHEIYFGREGHFIVNTQKLLWYDKSAKKGGSLFQWVADAKGFKHIKEAIDWVGDSIHAPKNKEFNVEQDPIRRSESRPAESHQTPQDLNKVSIEPTRPQEQRKDDIVPQSMPPKQLEQIKTETQQEFQQRRAMFEERQQALQYQNQNQHEQSYER